MFIWVLSKVGSRLLQSLISATLSSFKLQPVKMSFSKPSMDYGDARITPSLVAEVQSIIDGQGGSLTKFNRIMAIFASKKITYKAILSIWDALVHPDYRSGLGLNVFDCHKTLKSVKITGADRRALHRACAFEMAPIGAERTQQIEFNEQLIARSSNYLAKLRGQERVCSVSCSHFTAGCRAAVDSCPTTEEVLQDKNGN